MKKTFLSGLLVILLIALFQNFSYATPSNDLYANYVNTLTPSTNWYPYHGMNTSGGPTTSTDWNYSNMAGVFYIVPVGYANGIFAASFTIHISDATGATITSIDAGNIFGSTNGTDFQFETTNDGTNWTVNIVSLTLSNPTPAAGKNLAVVHFSLIKPIATGNPLVFTAADLRWYTGTGFSLYTTTTHDGSIKFFKGDFVTSPSDGTKGDGVINSNDLDQFTLYYWLNTTDGSYKFDIGSAGVPGYYDAIVQDGVINFEDLVMFAIGFGKSPGGLHVIPPMTNNPIEFSLGSYNSGTNEILVPVNISGNVTDLRGFSLTADMSNMEFVRVEKEGGLANQTSLLFGKTEGNTVFVDASVFEGIGIGTSGTVANIVLRSTGPKPTISLSTIKARNTNNEPFVVKIGGNSKSELPTSFGLNQNYPNPFNPSTMINYQIPKSAKVTLNIYDIQGKLVSTLVNGVQDAGKYSIEWKAGNNASGIYFCRINAGNFTDVKKMILAK